MTHEKQSYVLSTTENGRLFQRDLFDIFAALVLAAAADIGDLRHLSPPALGALTLPKSKLTTLLSSFEFRRTAHDRLYGSAVETRIKFSMADATAQALFKRMIHARLAAETEENVIYITLKGSFITAQFASRNNVLSPHATYFRTLCNTEHFELERVLRHSSTDEINTDFVNVSQPIFNKIMSNSAAHLTHSESPDIPRLLISLVYHPGKGRTFTFNAGNAMDCILAHTDLLQMSEAAHVLHDMIKKDLISMPGSGDSVDESTTFLQAMMVAPNEVTSARKEKDSFLRRWIRKRYPLEQFDREHLDSSFTVTLPKTPITRDTEMAVTAKGFELLLNFAHIRTILSESSNTSQFRELNEDLLMQAETSSFTSDTSKSIPATDSWTHPLSPSSPGQVGESYSVKPSSPFPQSQQKSSHSPNSDAFALIQQHVDELQEESRRQRELAFLSRVYDDDMDFESPTWDSTNPWSAPDGSKQLASPTWNGNPVFNARPPAADGEGFPSISPNTGLADGGRTAAAPVLSLAVDEIDAPLSPISDGGQSPTPNTVKRWFAFIEAQARGKDTLSPGTKSVHRFVSRDMSASPSGGMLAPPNSIAPPMTPTHSGSNYLMAASAAMERSSTATSQASQGSFKSDEVLQTILGTHDLLEALQHFLIENYSEENLYFILHVLHFERRFRLNRESTGFDHWGLLGDAIMEECRDIYSEYVAPLARNEITVAHTQREAINNCIKELDACSWSPTGSTQDAFGSTVSARSIAKVLTGIYIELQQDAITVLARDQIPRFIRCDGVQTMLATYMQ